MAILELENLPHAAATRLKEFETFEEGERGDKFVHQYSSREVVKVLNESGVRKEGYVCGETPKMLYLIDKKGVRFQKRKTSVEKVIQDKTLIDCDLQAVGL